ncbi:MAG: ribonuclease III [Selenomonadales bacterium]|nr:ribonuclease III [Selenomonadales bacterium]
MKPKQKCSAERIAELRQLSDKMGITFDQIELLHKALTHTSYANEIKRYTVEHNERLEFLGDAILDAIISDELFCRYPALSEGDLTKARAAIVCEGSLAECAQAIGFGPYLLLGRGENASGGRERASILADAFEAIVGAIYMDSGIESCRTFILNNLSTDMEKIRYWKRSHDYKTRFQEYVQKNLHYDIKYQVEAESGPAHNKVFTISVTLNGEKLGTGVGKSKKDAEQKAAREALQKLNEE